MAEEKTFEYLGKTLVRCGNTVYYGKKEDGIWLQLTILQTEKKNDLDLAKQVLIQIMDYRDGNTNIVKQSFGTSFYDAFELGSIWLEKALRS